MFIAHSSVSAVGQYHAVHESYMEGLSVRLENST